MNPKGIPETIRALLRQPLPGAQAQQRMAPRVRGSFPNEEPARQAGVMLLLYPDKEDLYTVFIKRNEYPGAHSGQISFPGGMYETRDRNLEETALRETSEETGIDHTRIDVLGALTPLHIPVSNIQVSPYVGWHGDVPVFDPDGTEVQYLVTTGLRELMDRENLRETIFIRHEREVETPYLFIQDETIWGATAMILNEFLELAAQMPQYRC